MANETLIQPHGGHLVSRFVTSPAEVEGLPVITLRPKQACDLEMIATGAFSPLTGFVGKADYESICRETRLADGTVWPIPITLGVDEATKASLKVGGRAALRHSDGT